MHHFEAANATAAAKTRFINENLAGLGLANVDGGRIEAAENANKARAAAAERDCDLNDLPGELLIEIVRLTTRNEPMEVMPVTGDVQICPRFNALSLVSKSLYRTVYVDLLS
jgi:hypothetical protein